jgi:hypothetical protein
MNNNIRVAQSCAGDKETQRPETAGPCSNEIFAVEDSIERQLFIRALVGGIVRDIILLADVCQYSVK